MRTPGQSRNKADADKFIDGAESDKLPWEKKLNRKYDRDSGKTINVRLPEHYAECLEYLAEQDNRSQHGELVHLITWAIDQAVSDTKKRLK